MREVQRGMEESMRLHGYRVRRLLFDPDREMASERDREAVLNEFIRSRSSILREMLSWMAGKRL
ncbi:MAG: hypothetical protein EOM14_00500 [Clostridia bacterium]|nr:hypothetical protein [Clostridia bacterium]